MTKLLLWFKSFFIVNKAPFPRIKPIPKPILKLVKETDDEELTTKDYSDELDDDWSLKNLLDQIDKTYDWLEESVWKNSWVHPGVIKAAHNIAPYVMRSDYLFDMDGYTEKFNYTKYNYPSIGCVALNSSNSKPDEEIQIGVKSVLYAKQDCLPWNYEKINGVAYLIGYCYKYKGETLYVSLYIVIDSDGFLHIPKEFKTIAHTIKKKKGGSISWYQNTFTRQQFLVDFKYENNHSSYKSAERQIKQWVCWVLNASIERDFNYSVIVEKNNRRVSFSLQGQNIVKFFRDRFKVETTKSGRRKTIFHSVKSYIRNNGSVVKMHIRGVTKFIWKDYNVSIFVPGYHGSGITSFGAGAINGNSQNGINMEEASLAIVKTLESGGDLTGFKALGVDE